MSDNLEVSKAYPSFPEGMVPPCLCRWCKERPAYLVAKDRDGFVMVCHECHRETFPTAHSGIIWDVVVP